MEAYGALEMLSQGLGSAAPVADCQRSFRELPPVEDTRPVGQVELQGSGAPYESAGTLGPASQVSGGGLVADAVDAVTAELSMNDPPLSRPISAPPNLGAISASTLFAYPPAESAGCVDFLLGDIRYDKQYCEFYKSHARDNPSLPKPLEESSLLDLLPRLRARAANKSATDSDNLSAATAGDSVSTSSDNRGEALAAAAAALLRQAQPEGPQGTGRASPAPDTRDAGASPPAARQQQTWADAHNTPTTGLPAAASRVATCTTRATYSGSSTERCSPHTEEDADADFASGGDWCGGESFGKEGPLAPFPKGPSPATSMGAPAAPALDMEGPQPCRPAFASFHGVQQLAATRTVAGQEHLDASVGAFLGGCGQSSHSPLGPSRVGIPGLRAYGGVPGAFSHGALSPSAAHAAASPRDSAAARHVNLLDMRQATAAAWLMSRHGDISLVAGAQGAVGGAVPDAWLAPSSLRLQGPLEVGGPDASCLVQEQMHRRQHSAKHTREQRRRHRTENSGLYEHHQEAFEGWPKPGALQDSRSAADLPLMAASGRPRASQRDNGAERLGSRGAGSRVRGGGSSGAAGSRREETGSPPRLSGADVLQADDGSLFRTAKDQGGCRLLQRLLVEGSPEEVDRVFNMAFARLVDLMTDAYGNYLFQKLLDVCSDEQLGKLLDAITPHLLDICMDPHGTRTAQKLVEVICGSRRSPPLTSDLIKAFEPLVVDLATNANGNHVIKRFLWCSTRENNACNIDFILQAACEHCVHIATDRHGCCVMQRCCEAASGALKEQLLAEIANHSLLLSQDPFGNYVVQHVLRHDHAHIGAAIIMRLRGHMRELSEQKFASNVVEKCLLLGDSEQRTQVIGELLEEPHELQKLVLHDYGNYVVQRALAVAGTTQQEALLDVVRFSLMHQHTSQHSRIAQKLMRRFRGLRQPPGTPGGASSNSNSWCCPSASAPSATAAHVEWASTGCIQLNAAISSGQVSPRGVQVQTFCRQQQRQQQHPADSHGTLKLLTGESPVEGTDFRFRPVSPL